MQSKDMRAAWLVGLVALVVGCGPQDVNSEVSPEPVETQVSSLDSYIGGTWQIYSGYKTSIRSDGSAYIEQTPTPSCWPVGTPLWRNISYWYTDSTGKRIYRGERNYRPNCNSNAWTSATFTFCSCTNTLTESYFTNTWTWTR